MEFAKQLVIKNLVCKIQWIVSFLILLRFYRMHSVGKSRALNRLIGLWSFNLLYEVTCVSCSFGNDKTKTNGEESVHFQLHKVKLCLSWNGFRNEL